MLSAVQIKPDIYWVGAVDFNVRNFHGYHTYRGSTYNAYLIMDEKITLIDTVKAPFADELIDKISQIVDPAKIDYLVSNHVEMDHSGSIPAVMKVAPNATIITSGPQGLNGLKAHYGDGYNYQTVNTGDTLNIGKRTLTFVKTMMVHWPDNMVTYDAYDKILFSNDAFGQHYASNTRFDDDSDMDIVLEQAKKYYANIVLPYSKQAGKAVEACGGLDIDMIAPGHGIIWRSHIDKIMECYKEWTSTEPQGRALVVYDSMWHSTEAMAKTIVDAFTACGINTRLCDLKVDHISSIITEVMDAKYVAVGSPTLNMTCMPNVAAFLCYLKGLSPKKRIGLAFGSYGWAAKGPERVAEELAGIGYDMPFGTYTQQWVPTAEDLEALKLSVMDVVRQQEGLA